jgi:hypothetical protein
MRTHLISYVYTIIWLHATEQLEEGAHTLFETLM